MGKRSRRRGQDGLTEKALTQRASAIAPAGPSPLQRGRQLQASGQFAAAEAVYERLLAEDPEHAEGHHLLGVLSLQMGRADAAVELISRSLTLRPGNAQAHANLGSALVGLKRPEEALEHYERALQIDPAFVAVQHNRANTLLLIGRHDEAAAAFALLLEAMPEVDFGTGNLFHARRRGCDWRQFEKLRQDVVTRVRSGRRVDRPFSFLSVSSSDAEQLECARTFTAATAPLAPSLWRGERYRHQRIRVAYVSADFRDHIVSHLMAEIYARHDRSRFEIVGAALTGSDASAVMNRTRASLEHFVDFAGMSDAEVAQRLRDMEIDIAVDLTGHTQGGRPRILARRPAPVQVSYLGFPGTLGSDYVDYILADEFVIPPDRQGFYAEKVVYLPDTFQANDHRSHLTQRHALGRQAAGLPDSALVFCCFNNTYKLNPAVFDVWMRIMNSVPDSVLWLVAGDSAMQARVCQEAASRSVIPERLMFAPRVPYEEHLARLSCADLFLDTLPFNAGATAGDALWASVPVLTCTGDAFASRMAGSLLRSFGMSELVSSSLEQYERTALDLSFDRERLAGYKLRLAAQRDTAPLFDSGRFCRNLEAAYETMWDRTERGEPPIGFAVQRAANRPAV